MRKALSAALAALLFLVAGTARAADGQPVPGLDLFPGADRIGDTAGTPPAYPVFKDGRRVGFVFSTYHVVNSTGYGGAALDVQAGVALDGRITGARLLRHEEPILVIGVSDDHLKRYVSGFVGVNVLAPALRGAGRLPGLPDAIAGATVSSAVIQDAVVRAARTVLRVHGGEGAASRLVLLPFAPRTWQDLIAANAVQHRRVTFAEAGATAAADPDGSFIDLYTALLTPPLIGGNILGERPHQHLMSGLGAGDNVILIAADGFYSFKGRSYRQTGSFDRIQLVQGQRTIALTRDRYENLERLKAAGAPELREAARFIIPSESGFDPTRPWRLDLAVREDGDTGPAARILSFPYALPADFMSGAPEAAAPEAPAPPLWQSQWQQRSGTVAGVVGLLAVLSAVLVFQDQLVRYRRFRDIGRLAYLGVVLVWLGWYAGGQLSVLQVLTFAHAFMTRFEWEHFLVDPVIFILWGFVAVTLLLWGRGVYCGWLCPFGALQELVNAAARRLRVPQIDIPFAVHERLWAIKYILFIGLFALSLHSLREAIVYAEVEPFKTAISLKFQRSWPFVAYVGGLIIAGLFIERFFCRYLCPLGAALAIPARLRTFNWLKRRHQCGSECQICRERCTVQAIHPTGEINPNECIHCLECQTYYFDDHVCPPLVQQRKRRERRLELSGGGTAEKVRDV